MGDIVRLQRICFVLVVLLSSISCRVQMSEASVEDPYVGEYALFAYAPSFVRITKSNDLLLQQVYQGTNPWAPPPASPAKLVRHSATRFSYGKIRLEFGEREHGRFQSLTMSPMGSVSEDAPQHERHRHLRRVDKIVDEYLRPERQEVYLERMLKDIAPGQYTYSRFISPARGPVDFAVYVPPDWQSDGKETYPLLFFLHGQDGSEHAFPLIVPAARLNSWIDDRLIPPFVLIALRSGRLNGVRANGTQLDGIEEQWSSARNETLLTSTASDEIRAFAQRYFRAGATPRVTSIHGHSRGALGALHFALKYPRLFASAVSNAPVSDYAFPQEAANARLHAADIIGSGILYRISIGDSDQFKELGRRMASDMHELLDQLKIEHEFEVLPNVTHDPRELWTYRRDDGVPNLLYELSMHARAWQKGDASPHQ